jgi:hypothetical protein
MMRAVRGTRLPQIVTLKAAKCQECLEFMALFSG